VLLLFDTPAGMHIPMAVLKGEAPFQARGVLSDPAHSAQEQNALLVHRAHFEEGSDTVYVPTSSSVRDEYWYYFNTTPGSARFIHLEPTGDQPVRVTVGWQDADMQMHARAKASGTGILPVTVTDLGEIVRTDTTVFTAQRFDMTTQGEIDILISPGKTPSLMDSLCDTSNEAFLIISGARPADRMKKQKILQQRLAEQARLRAERVDTYITTHSILRRQNTDHGGVREIIDVHQGTPIYAQTANLGAAKTSHADKIWSGGAMGLSVTGINIPAFGQWDAGPPLSVHREMKGRVTEKSTGAHSNHATHIAGTMVAAGIDSAARGMAYEGRLSSYSWHNILTEMAAEAEYHGMLLSQHSYVVGEAFYYDNLSAQWDDLHLHFPYKLAVKVAGNEGDWFSIRDAANAKNIITAGAIEEISGGWNNPADVVLAQYTSRGPTQNDLRVKPDLVAKGTNVYSTTVDGEYGYMSGTSMAGPAITGMLGLMQDYYYQTHSRQYMRAATLKALALHTAGDAGTQGPDASFGWGVIHPARAARLIEKNAQGDGSLIGEHRLQEDETRVFEYLGSGGEEIAATIVWPDPVGGTLRNDLDLRVFVDETGHMPWRLTGIGAAVRGDNTADNVEKVSTGIVSSAAQVRIEVSHKGTLVEGVQDFSLVVSGVEDKAEVLHLISPAEGDTLIAGEKHRVEWSSKGDPECLSLQWGVSGETWRSITDSLCDEGSYEWEVPFEAHDEVRFRIFDESGVFADESGDFTIIVEPEISIDFPAEGDTLWAGVEQEIRWTSRGDIAPYVDLHWGVVGTYWRDVAQGAPNTGSFLWRVPDEPADSSRFRVTDGSISGRSEVYTIARPPVISLSYRAIDTSLRSEEQADYDFLFENKGAGELSVAFFQKNGVPEISFSDTAFVVAPGEASQIQVQIKAGDLTEGTYEDTILVHHNDPRQKIFEIPVELTVSENHKPVFESYPETEVRQWFEWEYAVSVSDADGDSIDLRVEEKPEWISYDADTRTLNGIPGRNDTGDFRIVLAAGDGVVLKPVLQAFEMGVQPNRLPVFEGSDRSITAYQDSLLEIETFAFDPDGDAVVFETEGMPHWLSTEEPQDGLLFISGRPEAEDIDENYSLRIIARDGVDPEGFSQLNLTIAVEETDIIHIDTIHTASRTGIFPRKNPAQLEQSSFDFAVMSTKPAAVRVVIYDNLGTVLDTQEKYTVHAAGHTLRWDMRNRAGEKVGPGSYLIVAELLYEDGRRSFLKEVIGLRK
jgi:hypothetical protein